MSGKVLEVGDKLHIITRRLLENEARRHFVGEVIGISGELQEVRGYAFVFNRGTNEYKRRPEVRMRIFSLGQSGYIVNKLPAEVKIDLLQYRYIEKRLVVTDNGDFCLDINEFGHTN